MEFIAVKTRIVLPPQDDLFAVIIESLTDVQEGDVVLVSSKVVAIGEGRCVPIGGVDKHELIRTESDFVIPTEYRPFPLVIKNHTFLGAAGIDESNGNGYYILLPEDCFASAERLHDFLCSKYHVKNLGVIITDSRSLPLRFGASGVALGWWGIRPLQSHIGEPDLFGRPFRYERSNIVDGIAAAANLVGGETDECTPIVIARGVPNLSFVTGDTRAELFSPYEEDTFRVLYKDIVE